MKTSISKFLTKGINILLLMLLFVPSKSSAESWPFTLMCPPNGYLSCTADVYNLSSFGNATVMYGNNTYSAGQPTVVYNLNSCNVGTITRTWMVEDQYWNWHSCTQTIYVSSGGYAQPNIYWPIDIELTGCNPSTHPSSLPEASSFPTWDSGICSMLGRSYSDMEFYVNSQCRKIMRTWKVIDWCDFNPNTGYKIYTRTQIIYIVNNHPPTLPPKDTVYVQSFDCKDAEVNVPPLNLHPSICGGQFQITNDSKYAKSSGNNISGKYPVGTTKVTYNIKYGCNSTAKKETVVIVKRPLPTPYCLAQITTSLMPLDTDGDGIVDNGMVEVTAKNFDRGSFSKCSSHPLRFSFSRDVNDTKRILTCDHIGKNKLQMWVTDVWGGQEYCEVEVVVQNNAANIPNCYPQPDPDDEEDEADTSFVSIRGNVRTLTDRNLPNVEVKLTLLDSTTLFVSKYDTVTAVVLDSFINLSGYKLYRYIETTEIIETTDTIELPSSHYYTITDSLGRYFFDSIADYRGKVTIEASYNDVDTRFITDADLQLLRRLVAGDIVFQSYHQYLASDINEDGTIDNQDILLLESFLQGNIDEIPGTKWFVLDAAASFANSIDVLTSDLPNAIHLDSLVDNIQDINFVAIQKGNISIDPGSLLPQVVESRKSSSRIKTFPNPTFGHFNISYESTSFQPYNLEVYSTVGDKIFTTKGMMTVGTNIIALDASAWPHDGNYIFKLLIDNEVHNGMIMRISLQ